MGATLKDISAKAQVSVSTVSDILNNRKVSYSDKTKDRVWNIAKKMGYSPNPLARALSGAKTNLIGILADTFFKETSELELLASSKGYTVQLNAHHNNSDVFKNAFTDFSQRRADGILALSLNNKNTNSLKKLSKNMPVVTCSETVIEGFDCIHLPVELSTEMATDYLISLGHRKIAILASVFNEKKDNTRINGFKKSLKKHGIPFNKDICFDLAGNQEMRNLPFMKGYFYGKKALEDLGKDNLPSAMLCSTDEVAMGMITALHEAGIRVPEDISVMGMLNLDCAPFGLVPVTTVDYRPGNLYLEGMNRLIARIENPEIEPQLFFNKPEIIERKSCAPYNISK